MNSTSGVSVADEDGWPEPIISLYPRATCFSLVILGTGTVGKALLQLLSAQLGPAGTRRIPSLEVLAIANSRSMQIGSGVLHRCDWKRGELGGEAPDLDRLSDAFTEEPGAIPLIVDVTASQVVASRHLGWLRRGWHVVTANKIALAGSLPRYQALQTAAAGGRYGYETTVGAALPVIQTVRDLRLTGDRITEIKGVLSGTLSFLFGRFDGQRAFSDWVRDAHGRGLTEPDPRIDLTGSDVARKLLILAREAGYPLEPEAIQVESLVPPELARCDPQEAFARLALLDQPLQRRFADAASRGAVLRYTAELRHGWARVGVTQVARDHNLARLGHAENVIEIASQRYRPTPLTIRGPGAGAELTAAGILADILKVSGAGPGTEDRSARQAAVLPVGATD